jgi:N-sulfoglucosamine sulfohydrolase
MERRQLLAAPALLLNRGRAAGPRPNILLIVSEDNGPHLGCYGDRTVATPHLDSLAASGARWENAYVTQAVCSPSRSSILTGLYPHQNGQIGLATHAFTMVRNWPTLPGLLKQAGYRTGLIGKLHVNPESAFDFDFRWADSKFLSFGHRDVAKTAEVAGDFFSRGGPFFLMVSFADAHLPFLRQQEGLPARPLSASDVRTFPAVGVDTPRLREHVADYYNCLSRLDTGVGKLLAKLKDAGQEDGTLVTYLSDHGAQFSRGKATCYEFALRVPMMMRWPGRVRAGEVRKDLVSTVDLLPTLAGAAGARIPQGLPGRSILSRGASRTELFCEWNTSHSVPGPSLLYPQRTVRDRRYKLIVNLLAGNRNPAELYYTSQALVKTGTNQQEIDSAEERVRAAYQTWRQPPRLELYDLERDPYEFENLADRRELASVQSRLLAKLTDWQKKTTDPLADARKLALLEAENQEVCRRPQGSRSTGFRWRYPEYLYGIRTQ